MTKSRLYDVYFRIDGRWKYQFRSFFAFKESEYLERGFIAKIIPVRTRFYSGYNSRVWIRKCYNEGCSSGFWRFVENRLIDGWGTKK